MSPEERLADWLRSLCGPYPAGRLADIVSRPHRIVRDGVPLSAATDGKALVCVGGHLPGIEQADPNVELSIVRITRQRWRQRAFVPWDNLSAWAGTYQPAPPCPKCRGAKVRPCRRCLATFGEGKPPPDHECPNWRCEGGVVTCSACEGDGLSLEPTRAGQLGGYWLARNLLAKFLPPEGTDLVEVRASTDPHLQYKGSHVGPGPLWLGCPGWFVIVSLLAVQNPGEDTAPPLDLDWELLLS